MALTKDDFDLLNAFAHDLKNPLNIVKIYTEMMQRAGPMTDEQMVCVDKVMFSIERMKQVVEDMLTYAQTESDPTVEMKEVDLAQIIHNVIDVLQDAILLRNLQIMVDITPDLGPVVANEYMLEHLLANLISNAVKYNQHDGAIVVRVIDEISSVRVEVQDTGLGIDAEDQKQIFDRFFRSQSVKKRRDIAGNGLGLAIARSVVRRHGGHIWVDSNPNEGSTFSFTLPRDHTSDMPVPAEPQLIAQPEMHDETATELIDGLDDNLQESHEIGETDSRSDEV